MNADRADNLAPIRLAVLATTSIALRGVTACFQNAGDVTVAGGCTWERFHTTPACLVELEPDVVYVFDLPDDQQESERLSHLSACMPAAKVLLQLNGEQAGAETRFLRHAVVRGFLYSDDGPAQLAHAVRVIAVGKLWLNSEVLTRCSGEQIVPNALAMTLTQRELEVALLAGSGRSTREIAGALYISDATVKSHLNRVYRKLGIRNRVQLSRLQLEGAHPSGSTAASVAPEMN